MKQYTHSFRAATRMLTCSAVAADPMPVVMQTLCLCSRRPYACVHADPMPVTPLKLTPIPRSTSDASMGCDDDNMMESPPTRGMPDIKALAAALDPPPDMASLRVTASPYTVHTLLLLHNTGNEALQCPATGSQTHHTHLDWRYADSAAATSNELL